MSQKNSGQNLSINSLLTLVGVSDVDLMTLNLPNVPKELFRNTCSRAMVNISQDVSTPKRMTNRNLAMSVLLLWWKAGQQTPIDLEK